MPKILARANENLFDRVNQSVRKKGSEFVLKSEYAETPGKQITSLETPEKSQIQKERGKVKLNKSAKPADMNMSSIRKAM